MVKHLPDNCFSTGYNQLKQMNIVEHKNMACC
jgi:hypothetical protein